MRNGKKFLIKIFSVSLLHIADYCSSKTTRDMTKLMFCLTSFNMVPTMIKLSRYQRSLDIIAIYFYLANLKDVFLLTSLVNPSGILSCSLFLDMQQWPSNLKPFHVFHFYDFFFAMAF